MQDLSSFELISLAITFLSAIVLFAYKFPEAYKSFKPVKTIFNYGVFALAAAFIWNFAVDKTYSNLQNIIKSDSLEKASEIITTLTLSKTELLFLAAFFFICLFFSWCLGDIHDLLGKDKGKQ